MKISTKKYKFDLIYHFFFKKRADLALEHLLHLSFSVLVFIILGKKNGHCHRKVIEDAQQCCKIKFASFNKMNFASNCHILNAILISSEYVNWYNLQLIMWYSTSEPFSQMLQEEVSKPVWAFTSERQICKSIVKKKISLDVNINSKIRIGLKSKYKDLESLFSVWLQFQMQNSISQPKLREASSKSIFQLHLVFELGSNSKLTARFKIDMIRRTYIIPAKDYKQGIPKSNSSPKSIWITQILGFLVDVDFFF